MLQELLELIEKSTLLIFHSTNGFDEVIVKTKTNDMLVMSYEIVFTLKLESISVEGESIFIFDESFEKNISDKVSNLQKAITHAETMIEFRIWQEVKRRKELN